MFQSNKIEGDAKKLDTSTECTLSNPAVVIVSARVGKNKS